MFKWIKEKYQAFEAWVYSWFPGFKTRFVTAMGALASFSALAMEYVKGLQIEQFVTSKTMALISAGLFTLSYWLSNMGQRVKDAE